MKIEISHQWPGLIVLLFIAVVRYCLQVAVCRPLHSGDAIWRVELKCLKDGQSIRTLYIFNLSISCFKLTHILISSIAQGRFHKIVNFVFNECNERFTDD